MSLQVENKLKNRPEENKYKVVVGMVMSKGYKVNKDGLLRGDGFKVKTLEGEFLEVVLW